MNREQSLDEDWHCKFQNEEYLNLALHRIAHDSPPLHWCAQFVELIHNQFQDSTALLSVHDIGCNIGHFCRVVPELQYKVTYRGYDISEIYLGIARTRHPQYRFTLLDIATEKPAQQADVSIISATLEHVEKWELALSNILTSTKRQVLLRSFFGLQSTSHMYKKVGAAHPYLIRQFSFEQVAGAAESLGFTVRFLRDRATDSIPQYLGCGVTRTQYVAVLSKD